MHLRTPRTIRLSIAATAFAATLALSACASGSAAADRSDGLSIVATTTQLADFAQRIAGDDATVSGLLPAGSSAHHFDPAPKDLLALSDADVLIVNGAGLEGFIDSAVEASGFSGTVITAADGIDLEEAERITQESGEGADEHDHAADEASADSDDHAGESADEHAAHAVEDEHAEDEHAADEHDHDHGPVNPHLWTSPRYASDMAAEIATGLAAVDPDRAQDYETRAQEFEAELATLDEWIGAQFDRVPEAERVLVSGHDSLSYYLHDYGIRFAGSIMPSFEDNAEPSAAEIDALVAKIKNEGVTAVFVESSMSPKLARTIAREAGITVVDADALYADSLGAPGSGAESYIGATVHNTRLILDAWGAQVDPLPEVLASVVEGSE